MLDLMRETAAVDIDVVSLMTVIVGKVIVYFVVFSISVLAKVDV